MSTSDETDIPAPRVVEIIESGHVQLSRLRMYVTLRLPTAGNQILDEVSAIEDWIDEQRAMTGSGFGLKQRIDELVAEVRQLSNDLGQEQATNGNIRAHANQLREHSRALVHHLDGAWWLEAAHHYNALSRVLVHHVEGL